MTPPFRAAVGVALAVLLCGLFTRRTTAQPRALVDDIRIERFADAPPRAVRLDYHSASRTFVSISLDGEVYRIGLDGTSEVISTADDHGIGRLQGLSLHGDTLFLTGNVAVHDGKGTKGRVARGAPAGDGQWAWSTVFETEEFGTVKTAFDHGFNATVIDPTGRFLFVSSGSRTDHGEVQDNDGAYPNARDEAFTAAILRVPLQSNSLTLPNDEDALLEEGYLFARGIRNAYDMAFSADGHLFAVSNSADYDHPEDMFWVREGHHYGFPWVMGGLDNPQQRKGFNPDPERDPFLNPYSHAYSVGYFYDDPDFPERPAGVSFTSAIANVGPDANFYRDRDSGQVLKGSETGQAVTTFTPHRSLLGLAFDLDSTLAAPYHGDAFVLGWTNGAQSVLMGRLSKLGSDLLHLDLFYNPADDNYIVSTHRIVEGFAGPVDSELLGNDLYVLEHGGTSASIWRLTFPTAYPSN